MVHHYFATHGCGEAHAKIHADNCSGQNKNNAMLQYLMWRVLTGLHQSIELSFIVPGHTKFSPDGFFGLFKMKLRRSEVSSLSQLAQVMKDSTKGGFNKPQLVQENGKTNVFYYKWTDFLQHHFKRTPGMLSYNHFIFEKISKGKMKLKAKCTNDANQIVERDLLRKEFSDNSIPNFVDAVTSGELEPLVPDGMTEERKWYLFEKIRPFVDEEFQNELCPRPSLHKPVITKTAASVKENPGKTKPTNPEAKRSFFDDESDDELYM